MITAKNCLTAPPGDHPCGSNLYLIVADTGARRWLFRYQRDGHKQSIGLGSAALVSFAEAKDMAIDHRRALAKGFDPKAMRDEKRQQHASENGPRFGDYASAWRGTYEKSLTHRASRDKLTRITDVFCKPLHKLRMSEITTQHIIADVLRPIWQQVENARDTRQVLNRIFNAAIADKLRNDNPADWESRLKPKLGRAPKRGRVRGHNKAVRHHDLPALVAKIAAIDSSRDRCVRALEILIMAVARTAEVMNMKWSQVDLDTGVWTIEARDLPHDTEGGEGTKNGRDKLTPLPRQALVILRELHQERISDYVFPGRDLSGPMSNMTMLKRLKELTGDDAITVHGLRGTFRTWAQDETEFDRETVEHCMHHILGDAAEQAYKHGKALRKRRAVLQAWADFVTRKPAKVIAMSPRAA